MAPYPLLLLGSRPQCYSCLSHPVSRGVAGVKTKMKCFTLKHVKGEVSQHWQHHVEGTAPGSSSSGSILAEGWMEGGGGAHPETSHHLTLPFSAQSPQFGKKPHALPAGKPQGQIYLQCFVPCGAGHHPAAATGGTAPIPPAAGQGTHSDEPPPRTSSHGELV